MLNGFREGRQKFENAANLTHEATQHVPPVLSPPSLSGSSLSAHLAQVQLHQQQLHQQQQLQQLRESLPTQRRLTFPMPGEHVSLSENGKVRESLSVLLEKDEVDGIG